MVRVMLDDWGRTRRRLREMGRVFEGRSAVIATATLAAPGLAAIAAEFSALSGAKIEVSPTPVASKRGRGTGCGACA